MRRVELALAEGDPETAATRAAAYLASHPGSRAMRRLHVMALADAERRPEAVASYQQWHQAHGHDDVMLEDLAMLTLRSRVAAPQAQVRIAAILAIEALQLDAFADDVALRMNDGDDEVAAYAAIAILRGYQDSIAALQQLIASTNARARAVVVAGLAKKVGAQALPIVQTRAADASPLVRVEVARALGASTAAVHRTQLLAMTKDGDAQVVAAALAALGASKACAQIAGLRANMLPALAQLPEVVARAMLALPCPADPNAAAWVLRASQDARVAVRLAAARAPTAPASQAVTLAAELLASPAASDRRRGLALRDRVPAARQDLILAAARRDLGADDPWLALIAADVLRVRADRADQARAAAAYARDLTAQDDVALAAACALAPLGDAAAIARLAAFAANTDPRLAQRALQALALAPTLSPALVAALATDDERAVTAARAILRHLRASR